MDETKLYLCFEGTNANGESVYLIYSTKVSDLMGRGWRFTSEFTLEKSISGVSAMVCGLFDSKIILAGGVSCLGEKTEYNRGLVTYDPASKKVAREDFPNMYGRKTRPFVIELYERLYVLDTSNSIYKRNWEVYYPTKKIWGKVNDPFTTIYNAPLGTKNVSGRTPYSWFVSGMTMSISLPSDGPSDGFTYFHHARQVAKCFTIDSGEPLPFHGMATTYSKPGLCDVLVISFCKGMVGGQGRVEGRGLRYAYFHFSKPELIFKTDPYEKPDGEVSSYFYDCENGKFCLTTFDNMNIHVYVFKIFRRQCFDGTTTLVLKDLDKHKYKFSDFSGGGFSTVSLSGCFVLPRDDKTKRSEESKLYSDYFYCYESEGKDDDIPPLVNTNEGLKIHPDYESDGDGADNDLEVD